MDRWIRKVEWRNEAILVQYGGKDRGRDMSLMGAKDCWDRELYGGKDRGRDMSLVGVLMAAGIGSCKVAGIGVGVLSLMEVLMAAGIGSSTVAGIGDRT